MRCSRRIWWFRKRLTSDREQNASSQLSRADAESNILVSQSVFHSAAVSREKTAVPSAPIQCRCDKWNRSDTGIHKAHFEFRRFLSRIPSDDHLDIPRTIPRHESGEYFIQSCNHFDRFGSARMPVRGPITPDLCFPGLHLLL
jgi:hypothetical protein